MEKCFLPARVSISTFDVVYCESDLPYFYFDLAFKQVRFLPRKRYKQKKWKYRKLKYCCLPRHNKQSFCFVSYNYFFTINKLIFSRKNKSGIIAVFYFSRRECQLWWIGQKLQHWTRTTVRNNLGETWHKTQMLPDQKRTLHSSFWGKWWQSNKEVIQRAQWNGQQHFRRCIPTRWISSEPANTRLICNRAGDFPEHATYKPGNEWGRLQ